MNIVNFPGLNLELNIQNKFNIFGLDIYFYSVIIVSAILIALYFCRRNSGKFGIEFKDILDLSLWLLPISIISARLYYVAFNMEQYMANPAEILNLRGGGLAIYGAIIGGLITTIVFCKVRKINLLDLLDYIIPYLALGQALGRWGNFLNIEAYGIETSLPWRMGIYESGIYKEVHPAFLYESIATFLIFLLLHKKSKNRKYKGNLILIYFATYSLIRFFIEGLRIDSLMLGNFRISQILSLVIFVVSCSIIANIVIKSKKRLKELEKTR